MTTTRTNGRFTRSPQTFAKRVEAEVFADLKADLANARRIDLPSYQHRAVYLSTAFDKAAERLLWIEANS